MEQENNNSDDRDVEEFEIVEYDEMEEIEDEEVMVNLEESESEYESAEEKEDFLERVASGNNYVTFDITLPSAHSYLSQDWDELSGRTVHEEGSIIAMPILSFPGVVLMPGQQLPLHLFRNADIAMIKYCLEGDKTFGQLNVVRVLREGTDGYVHTLSQVGTTVEILAVKEEDNMDMKVKTLGRQRFEVLTKRTDFGGNILATVRILPEKTLPEILSTLNHPIPYPYLRHHYHDPCDGDHLSRKGDNDGDTLNKNNNDVGDGALNGNERNNGDNNIESTNQNISHDDDDDDDNVSNINKNKKDTNKSTDNQNQIDKNKNVYNNNKRINNIENNNFDNNNKNPQNNNFDNNNKNPQNNNLDNNNNDDISTYTQADTIEEMSISDKPTEIHETKIPNKIKKPYLYSAAMLTHWPEWVYKQYDCQILMRDIRHEMKAWNDKMLTSSVPQDPDHFSYWVASSLPLDDVWRMELLRINSCQQRLRFELSIMKKCTVMCCNRCNQMLAKKDDVFSMSTVGPLGTYVNPGGHVHETLTVYQVTGLHHVGKPSTEASWFPGYAWTIVECSTCHKHMGWRFTVANKDLKHIKPQRFWGLCRAGLVPGLISSEQDINSNDSDDSNFNINTINNTNSINSINYNSFHPII